MATGPVSKRWEGRGPYLCIHGMALGCLITFIVLFNGFVAVYSGVKRADYWFYSLLYFTLIICFLAAYNQTVYADPGEVPKG